jgi:hypothetical protein
LFLQNLLTEKIDINKISNITRKISQLNMNNIRISNTGIIFYSNINNSFITSMLHDIYNSCTTLQQPECQIFWALYSQNYLEDIKQIEFDKINPLWKAP